MNPQFRSPMNPALPLLATLLRAPLAALHAAETAADLHRPVNCPQIAAFGLGVVESERPLVEVIERVWVVPLAGAL